MSSITKSNWTASPGRTSAGSDTFVETHLTHAIAEFSVLALANNATFELSQAVSGHPNRLAIAEKGNQIIVAVMRVVPDDFGANRDGLGATNLRYVAGVLKAVDIRFSPVGAKAEKRQLSCVASLQRVNRF